MWDDGAERRSPSCVRGYASSFIGTTAGRTRTDPGPSLTATPACSHALSPHGQGGKSWLTSFSARHSLNLQHHLVPGNVSPVRLTACRREPDAQRRPGTRRVRSCLGGATATFFLLPNGKAAIIGYLLVMTSSHRASGCYLLRPNSLPAHSWEWKRLFFLKDLHVLK